MVSSVPESPGPATALWLLAGLDPSGGAGLLRDTLTARACAPHLPLARVVTTWTRQGHGRPATVEPRPAPAIVRELRSMPTPRAIKIGLLPGTLAPVVVAAAAEREAPVVVDPVLAASDGGDLGARVDVLKDVLRDMSKETWLITPNRLEAAALAGCDADDPALAQRVEARLGRAAVLVKDIGGDREWVRDVVCRGGELCEFERPRGQGPDPRGTGCALATAIACGLADKRPLLAAVAAAVGWLDVARTHWVLGPDARAHLPDQAPPLR